MLALQRPTWAFAPLMLEDYHKIMVDRMGDEEQFTLDHVRSCTEKGTSNYYWQHYTPFLPLYLPLLSS